MEIQSTTPSPVNATPPPPLSKDHIDQIAKLFQMKVKDPYPEILDLGYENGHLSTAKKLIEGGALLDIPKALKCFEQDTESSPEMMDVRKKIIAFWVSRQPLKNQAEFIKAHRCNPIFSPIVVELASLLIPKNHIDKLATLFQIKVKDLSPETQHRMCFKAVCIAIYKRKFEEIKQIRDLLIPLSLTREKTLLDCAVKKNWYHQLRKAFALELTSELQGAQQNYPLHIAAEKGYSYMVKVLVKEGFPLDTTDLNGKTPLDLGYENGNLSVAKKLIELGALLDIPKALKCFEQDTESSPEMRDVRKKIIAFWVSRQPLKNQAEFIKAHRCNPIFSPIVVELASLLIPSKNSTDIKAAKAFFNALYSPPSDLSESYTFELTLRCLATVHHDALIAWIDDTYEIFKTFFKALDMKDMKAKPTEPLPLSSAHFDTPQMAPFPKPHSKIIAFWVSRQPLKNQAEFIKAHRYSPIFSPIMVELASLLIPSKNSTDIKAAQAFFRALYSPPSDLAKSYTFELTLRCLATVHHDALIAWIDDTYEIFKTFFKALDMKAKSTEPLPLSSTHFDTPQMAPFPKSHSKIIAFWASRHPLKNQAEFIKAHRYSPIFSPIMVELASLLIPSKNSTDIKAAQAFFNALYSPPSDLAKSYTFELTLRCLATVHNDALIDWIGDTYGIFKTFSKALDMKAKPTEPLPPRSTHTVAKHRRVSSIDISRMAAFLKPNSQVVDSINEQLLKLFTSIFTKKNQQAWLLLCQLIPSFPFDEKILRLLVSRAIKDTKEEVCLFAMEKLEKIAQSTPLPDSLHQKLLNDLNKSIPQYVINFAKCLVKIGLSQKKGGEELKSLFSFLQNQKSSSAINSAYDSLKHFAQLGKIPRKLLSEIIRLIEDQDKNKKRMGIVLLGLMGLYYKLKKKVIRPLVSLINDEDVKIARDSITALGQIAKHSPIPLKCHSFLLPLLGRENNELRSATIKTLTFLGTKESHRSSLCPLLKEQAVKGEGFDSLGAAEVLAKILGNKPFPIKVEKHLIELYKNKSLRCEILRMAAEKEFPLLSLEIKQTLDPLVLEDSSPPLLKEKAARLLGIWSKENDPPDKLPAYLMHMLESLDPPVRSEAVKAAGTWMIHHQPPEELVTSMLTLLADHYKLVRQSAFATFERVYRSRTFKLEDELIPKLFFFFSQRNRNIDLIAPAANLLSIIAVRTAFFPTDLLRMISLCSHSNPAFRKGAEGILANIPLSHYLKCGLAKPAVPAGNLNLDSTKAKLKPVLSPRGSFGDLSIENGSEKKKFASKSTKDRVLSNSDSATYAPAGIAVAKQNHMILVELFRQAHLRHSPITVEKQNGKAVVSLINGSTFLKWEISLEEYRILVDIPKESNLYDYFSQDP